MKLKLSIGNSRMDKKWNAVEMELSEFRDRISQTKRTAETVEQYRKLGKAKQAVAELDAAQAEAADVGKHVERAVRAVAADAVDLGEAVEQDAAAALKDLTQLFAELRMVERNGRRVLAGGVGAGVEVFLTLGHAVNDLRRGCDKADAPAGHRIGL